ncbi:MAG: efflux transporter outer membrane subunit [Planctomycetes bacterium]|nr:efflux transporter outer membrane subunit [Planctomycetota bacterium]
MPAGIPAAPGGRIGRATAGILSLLAGLLSLPACISVGPDYVAPEPDVPAAWHEPMAAGLEAGPAALGRWWTQFGDPLLASLIERAAAGNPTVREAFFRIEEARAEHGVAAGEYFPEVEGFATATRGRESANESRKPPSSRRDRSYTTGLGASWELDVWGRVRRAVESADASIEASVEDRRDVLVLLCAEVAATYVDVRALQARIAAARSNAENQRGTLKITEDRFRSGLAPALDVAQAKLNVATSEASIPELEIALAAATNRLATLVAESASTLHGELATAAPVPAPPASVAIGAPADVIRQRPDVRRAERTLAAQTARIGMATAELYPRLSLEGILALDSYTLRKLLRSSSTAWSLSPELGWNLFAAGRLRAAIRVEEARTAQALAAWQSAVLLALEDVENALVAYQREKVRRDALGRAVEAAEEAVRLSKESYRAGLSGFQNVLDSERSLLEMQDDLAESEGLVTRSLVHIYRALGGGCDSADPDAGAGSAKERAPAP